MKSTVKERLIAFISYLGMSKNAFENACGLSTRYVSNISASVSPDKLKKISLKFPELNVEWLLTGQGNMLREIHSTPSISQTNINGDNNYVIGNNTTRPTLPAAREIEEAEYVEVECPSCGTVVEVPSTAILPLVPVEVAKRPDTNLEFWRENHPQEMQEVDLRKIWGGGVFLMRVDTRAMEPEYREGTFLVLRKLIDPTYARADGSAYVIDTLKPHTLFRYLSKERDGGYVLTAENDRRGPIYLGAADILNIYDIVGSFRIGR